jgi:hypothetical protein
MQFYCPACWARIHAQDVICPACGVEIPRWFQEHSYTERLIHALRHPNPEARMAAIISLGNRGEAVAAIPLATCALAHPRDVVQALAIVRSISQLPEGSEQAQALAMLAEHPAQSVRTAVARLRGSRP